MPSLFPAMDYTTMINVHLFENDVTSFVHEDFLKGHGLTKVIEVYAVDLERCKVHICSFDPSMEAFYVGVRWEFEDEFRECSEEEEQEVLSLALGDRDTFVEYFRWWDNHEAVEKSECVGEFEDMDDAIEYMQGNGYVDA